MMWPFRNFFKKQLDDYLIDRWINNNQDQEAYNEFYERHKDRILNFAISRIKNREIADETVQHCFMVFLKYPDSFKNKKNLLSYFFSIARNYLHQEKKIKFNEVSLEEQLEEGFDLVDKTNLLGNLTIKERFKIIEELFNELPDEHQEIYRLHRFEELHPKEISEIIGKDAKQISNILYQVEQKMKKRLLEKFGEDYE